MFSLTNLTGSKSTLTLIISAQTVRTFKKYWTQHKRYLIIY